MKPPLILGVGFYQEFYLKAIFRSLIDDQKIRVDKQFTDDAVTARAWTVLLRQPEAHLAIVLETRSEDPPEDPGSL